MTGAALILQGDALHLPLADESVDLVICSPPYYSLRAYSAGPGEIGSEATLAEFLDALWAATREMARVLKPTGSIFVMLGDKYATAFGPNSTAGKTNWSTPASRYDGSQRSLNRSANGLGAREKSLMGLPWRYAIGCIDGEAGDALILRSEIIWSKPNGLLPESVTDRVRRSHEQVFHLTRQPRYYSAIDEIRTPHSAHALRYYPPGGAGQTPSDSAAGRRSAQGRDIETRGSNYATEVNPLGALPGSVWSVPSEPLRLPDHLGVQHYAAFPSEWPRRLILGWSPPGICLDCGQGRVPVVEREVTGSRGGRQFNPSSGNIGYLGLERSATILGYACACTPHTDHPERRGKDFHAGTDRAAQGMNDGNGGERFRRYQEELANPRGPVREYHLDGWRSPPTRPAVVLDCFSGTGTVPMVARALGRIGIGVDLSMPYCRAARWRVHHDADKAISRTNLERQGSLL